MDKLKKDLKQDYSNFLFSKLIKRKYDPYDFRNMIAPIWKKLDYQGIARRSFIINDLKRKYNICG